MTYNVFIQCTARIIGNNPKDTVHKRLISHVHFTENTAVSWCWRM